MASRTGGASSGGGMAAPATGSNVIGGTLNFGGGGGGMFYGGAEGLAGSYNAAYNSALSANQQNYNNILSGYQATAQNQQNAQQNITQGYNTLTNQVLGGINGSANAQRAMIDKSYAQQAAQASQQLTNAGLNNTTVVNSLQRGITFDQQLAQTNLANQFAQLDAQYRSQLGLAGLDYQNQANMQNTAWAGQQLNWMNSVEIPYPDAQGYTQLMSYYGQIDQANQDRDMMKDLYGSMSGGSSGSSGGGGGGFSGTYGKTQSAGGAMPYYGSASGTSAYQPGNTYPGVSSSGSSYGTPGLISYPSSYDYAPADMGFGSFSPDAYGDW